MNKAVYCILALLVLLSACTYVGPGEEGVVIPKVGTNREITPANVKVGNISHNPWTTIVIKYPNRVERTVWEGDQAVSFNAQGVRLSAGVALAMNVKPGESYQVVQRYGNTAFQVIRDGIIRDAVRDALGNAAANKKLLDLLTTQRELFVDEAEATLRTTLEPQGFMVEQLSLTTDFTYPDRIAEQLNGIQEAQNFAIEQQARVQATIAEANSRREAAKGEADAEIERARGQAEAFEILNQALENNPRVLELRTVEKWNGVLPRVLTGTEGAGIDLLIQSEPSR